MPAPDHLLPILEKLGDGGTVPLAEAVHQMLADARSEAAAAAQPRDVADLEQQLSTTKAHFQRRCDTLTERAQQAEAELEQVRAAVVELAPAPVALTVVGEVEAGKWYLLREPADLTDDGAMELAAQLEKLHEATGASFVVITSGGELTELACPEGVDPESWALMLAQWAMPRRYLTTDVEAERITRTGSNTTGATTATVDVHALIEASSLGEPDAVAARESVPLEVGQAIAARAAALTPAELDDDIDWDDGPAPHRLPCVDGNYCGGPHCPPEPPQSGPETTPDSAANPSNADVRAWCIANRVPVNAKGAVRADARAAYDAAHQGA